MATPRETLPSQVAVPEAAPQELTLALEGLGPQGEALALYEGRQLPVLGGIPGEEVVARLLETRRARAAQVVRVLKPSPYRVEAPCPYYGPCTGCQWQHIAYPRQLELKRQRVQQALDAPALLAPSWPKGGVLTPVLTPTGAETRVLLRTLTDSGSPQAATWRTLANRSKLAKATQVTVRKAVRKTVHPDAFGRWPSDVTYSSDAPGWWQEERYGLRLGAVPP